MATATAAKRTVLDEVQLTLTRHEAETLFALVGRGVKGDDYGPRRHSSAIYNALDKAGVARVSSVQVSGTVELTGKDSE